MGTPRGEAWAMASQRSSQRRRLVSLRTHLAPTPTPLPPTPTRPAASGDPSSFTAAASGTNGTPSSFAAAGASATSGTPSSYAAQYYEGTVAILRALRADAAILGAVARDCADAIRRGRTAHCNLVMGHMPGSECLDSRAGNPQVFNFNTEDYEGMAPGDVLLTHAASRAVRRCRERGVAVAAFTCPYVQHSAWPPNQILPSEDGLLLEDVADRVVDSHIPWQQGLVAVPGRPEFPAFPSSSTATCTIFWMLSAEIAELLSGAPTTVPLGRRAEEYVDFVLERLGAVAERTWPELREAGAAIAGRVLSGGRLLVRGDPGLASETHWVASGMWLPDWYPRDYQRPDPHGAGVGVGDFLPGPAPLRAADAGGDKDTTLIAAIHSGRAEDAADAAAGRGHGHLVVAVAPPAAEAALRQAGCSRFLSNRTAEEAGVVTISHPEGSTSLRKVCPASGVVGNVMVQMLLAEVAEALAAAGETPYFMMNPVK